jgi:hypothetical protein
MDQFILGVKSLNLNSPIETLRGLNSRPSRTMAFWNFKDKKKSENFNDKRIAKSKNKTRKSKKYKKLNTSKILFPVFWV